MSVSVTTKPAPILSDDQVLRAVCGLRPCRHGGLRLETEQFGHKRIIHHYGHGGCGVTIAFGTAKIATQRVQQEASANEPVAVLGAGVVGLATARMLAQLGYSVTIYSDKVGAETTSALAGALWLPVGIEFGDSPQDLERKDHILRESLTALRALDANRYGIEQLDVYEPEGSHTEEGLFGKGLIEEPQPINAFPFPCDAVPGRMFSTLFIHTPRFLRALLEDVQSAGIPIVNRRFVEQSQLTQLPERVMVNCLAMGSKTLFNDPNVYAARGVLVHVKPQPLGYCVHDGYKYMFPREDALILGGCFQPDREDDTPDDEMVSEILKHHRRFFGSACGIA
ncbi:MAG: FAD-dependent oxidoreductase [Phycisphaerales bacterium JB052]